MDRIITNIVQPNRVTEVNLRNFPFQLYDDHPSFLGLNAELTDHF